jgi:UPF0755 protein
MRLLRLLLLLVLVGAAVLGWWVYAPVGPEKETFVDIAPGTGSKQMAAQLESAGIIRSQWAFDAMRMVHGGALKAGEYRFDHPATLVEVYKRLRAGDVYTKLLVVPEGYNIFDIAMAVQAAGLGDAAAFLKAEQQHTELIAAWSPGARSLEGYLFPDSYRFSPRATPAQMLAAMVKRFRQKTAAMGLADGNLARTVTMASLVEKEVHIAAERPLVAGVFMNRLVAGMPLQTDPAVVYASLLRGTWTGVIHQSELHSDSAYNTYVHTGLPPGPICNPGVDALRAAMKPAQTEYLYFVARADGQTAFARTLAEHDVQVAELRKGGD